MPKIWKLKPQAPEDFCERFLEFDINFASPLPRIECGASSSPPHSSSAKVTADFQQGGGINHLMPQLLYNRGLIEKEQIQKFLQPKYEDLYNPFLFKDMEKAVERIWQAIDQSEKICVYGDYDADAVTANAVLRQTFAYLGVKVESYIPDRFTEGYGVNLDALEKISSNGAKLIITVDCGTNSIDAAEFCRQHQIDLIITDHHEIIGEKPEAYALINPKNREDNYPDENITGVGVAFKLACGILPEKDKVINHLSFLASASEPRNPLNSTDKGSLHSSSDALRVGRDDSIAGFKYIEGYEKWLLDLVAIGTVADCHSLLGENRILVKYGLKVLAKTKWPGLRALVRSSALDFSQKLPDTYTLGFVIAPRLNAAGRLEHADLALNLLMETDSSKAQDQANQLELINRRRQDYTQRILSEAREKSIPHQDKKILVLMGEDWHKGVVGLVAGRLAEEFHKPVIVLEKGKLESTGSARTAGEFNLVAALKYSSAHLVRFGGHKQAAGLTLKTLEYEIFYQKLLEFAETGLSDEDLEKVLILDAELKEQDLQLKTYNLLTFFEPFGVDNPKPKFLVKDLTLLRMKAVGSEKKHIQFVFQKGARKISGIGFNLSYVEKMLKVGDTVEVAAELIEDGWNGRTDIKLRVVDVKKS